VVVPDSDRPESAPDQMTSLKRRQSDISEDQTDSKRARLSSEDHGVEQDHMTPKAAEDISPIDGTNGSAATDEKRIARRRTGREEEKKRGQRMFGVLLGALSSGGTAEKSAKRRADIERRQAEKLKQLEEDVSQREREQAEKLTRIRRKEQWGVDEAAVRIIWPAIIIGLLIAVRCALGMRIYLLRLDFCQLRQSQSLYVQSSFCEIISDTVDSITNLGIY
jgi:pinin/SDK/memA/ protein conserved region